MVEFKIFRFDPEKDRSPRFDRYQVPAEKGMTVLEGLWYILDNLDGSLSFRSSCRAAVCGSCTMHINDKYRLACNTQIETFKSGTVVIQPLAHLPVLKDLVVDLANFFRNYEEIKPYLIPSASVPDKEFVQSPAQRKKIDGAIDCILCGACYGSCPIATGSQGYLGPHAFLKAARFVYDSRDGASDERFALISHSNGLFRCHTVFNCQMVCPKNLDPSGAIAKLKMKAIWNSLRKLLPF
jgi:succinate dehydrogenase / fumarate reductase iron-sulfur subunit